MAFDYLQEGKLHNLPGQPVPGLGHPPSEKVFPDFQRGTPAFPLLPLASGPVAVHHWKEQGSVLSALSLRVFVSIEEI